MIRYEAEICRDLPEAQRREWLETNGIGGFASSTIAGLNTRRYHGLLTATLRPPLDRNVLLSKLEETLIVNGKRYELACNQYPGVVHPRGYLLQTEFRLDPFPVFTWQVENVELRKSLFLVQGENTVVVQYHLRAQGDQANSVCQLEIKPLIAFRDYHATTHANGALNPYVETAQGLTTIQPYGDLPALHFAHDPASVDTKGDWYRNFEYAEERERGLDYQEDLFQPFTLTFDLATQATIIASLERHRVEEAAGLRQTEVARRKSGWTPADHFIVKRAQGKSVIAGYHWFGDWGRDTMISLSGLTLATGQPDVARDILAEFALNVSEGMLPNRFPDHEEQPEYNTVDATLWYFEAIRAWLANSGDMAFAQERLLPVMRDIIAYHRKGTRYGIKVDADGLLNAGAPGVQLTWMDAKVGDWVVTPRYGKPVEIQALWYNALRIMQQLTGEAEYGELADTARSSFATKFWNEEGGCLFDVISDSGKDAAIRPNQLFAISLEHKILEDRAKAEKILDVVQRELLTPFGLRTLSPKDPAYKKQYTGNPLSRDGAYHQGTVWPWLIGPFSDAYAYVHGDTQATQWLTSLERFQDESGVGHVPEIFDGDPPHEARGCISQAWSLAEILRIKSKFGAP